jgi:CheY-like chemotaxis protein
MGAAPIHLLMAEDDENDIVLFTRVCERSQEVLPFFVRDGLEATHYLEGVGAFSNRTAFPFPRWLMIDLKMPRMDGFELLSWLRAHPQCRVVPTIVFSASELPGDIQRSYELGAHSYFTKPLAAEEMAALLQTMVHYWHQAKLPP